MKVFPIAGLFFYVFFVSSEALSQSFEARENYNGARGNAMGGADTAVVNDETALLVNPAALGKVRDFYGTILDPEIEGSYNYPSLYQAKPFTEFFRPDLIQPTLSASPNSHYHAKLQLFPSIVVRNFGFGIYTKKLLDARVDSTGTNMNTFYQDDLGLILGFNFSLWGGRIKIGASGKVISRIEIDKAIPVAGTLTVAANASEGVGVGGDVGVILTAPVAWLPTFSAVVHDVGGTKFNATTGVRLSSLTQPATRAQDYDLALAVFPIHGNYTRSSFTAEYKNVQAASTSADKARYVHVGYEFNYADTLFLRLGMNQRYWTTGFEFATRYAQIQFSYFGEDIGPIGSPEEERRWLWKFVFRF